MAADKTRTHDGIIGWKPADFGDQFLLWSRKDGPGLRTVQGDIFLDKIFFIDPEESL
jgi:hypothetical protein